MKYWQREQTKNGRTGRRDTTLITTYFVKHDTFIQIPDPLHFENLSFFVVCIIRQSQNLN